MARKDYPLTLLSLTPPERAVNWAVLVPVVTGFLCVYYLLPVPRPRRIALAVIAGALGLGGLGLFLAATFSRAQPATVEGVLFGAFAVGAVAFGVLMIAQRNPARAALCFALVILNVCGLFLLLAAPFLMAATIIIYAGAIIVTFLFVVMLSQQVGYTDANDRSREPFLSAAVGFILLGTLFVVLQRAYDTRDVDRFIENAGELSRLNSAEEMSLAVPRPGEYRDQTKQFLGRLGFDLLKPDAPGYPAPVQERLRAVDSSLLTIEEQLPDRVNEEKSLGESLPFVDVPLLQGEFARLQESLAYLKAAREGLVVTSDDVHLSPYGQVRPVSVNGNEEIATKQLPAANVAAIGRTLFSDHLLAVELAGTLLLVATIGAIAIAGGRAERNA